MKLNRTTLTVATVFVALSALTTTASAKASQAGQNMNQGNAHSVQLGPRPFYLVDKMESSQLKADLQKCAKGPFKRTDFSIGHRGAPLQFPEHTKESYEAAARQGAGILECDVTFTKDLELVRRHSQCDLHTTTNILTEPELAAKCSVPPEFDPLTGELVNGDKITCCTSDITLAEFKMLKGKMDAANTDATAVEEFLGGTANWRTDLYSTGGTLLTHAESIELFRGLGAKYTPELKSPSVTMPFDNPATVENENFTQEDYAQKMIDEYKAAGIDPRDVYAQSFDLDDVLYWVRNEPAFGQQAVFLDGGPIPRPDPATFLEDLADQGVKIVAPPMPMLLTVDNGKIVPSDYATAARFAGLDIITWTLERSSRIVEDVLKGGNTFYYQTTLDALENDGDIMVTLDVLAQNVNARLMRP